MAAQSLVSASCDRDCRTCRRDRSPGLGQGEREVREGGRTEGREGGEE